MIWETVSMEQAFIHAQGKVLMEKDLNIELPRGLEEEKSFIKFSDNTYILCVSNWRYDDNKALPRLPVFYVGKQK